MIPRPCHEIVFLLSLLSKRFNMFPAVYFINDTVYIRAAATCMNCDRIISIWLHMRYLRILSSSRALSQVMSALPWLWLFPSFLHPGRKDFFLGWVCGSLFDLIITYFPSSSCSNHIQLYLLYKVFCRRYRLLFLYRYQIQKDGSIPKYHVLSSICDDISTWRTWWLDSDSCPGPTKFKGTWFVHT